MKYTFDEKKHLHLLDGKKLTGCTTVLNVVAKPFLIQWAANMATEYMKKWYDEGADLSKFIDTIGEARTAHCKKRDKAGDFGTKLHAEVENYIKEQMEGEHYDYTEKINPFIKWTEKNEVKFLASEKNVWSETLWLGGIVDFVCEIDGEVWIGDIKTSKSGIYADNFWQCAGYDLMLKDMKEPYADKIKGYVILNLKENGDFLEKRSVSNGENVKAFKACLDIYRIKEKITNQVL